MNDGSSGDLLIQYTPTYLLYFCFYIPQDNLIVAVLSVYKCWNALWKKDRDMRNKVS